MRITARLASDRWGRWEGLRWQKITRKAETLPGARRPNMVHVVALFRADEIWGPWKHWKRGGGGRGFWKELRERGSGNSLMRSSDTQVLRIEGRACLSRRCAAAASIAPAGRRRRGAAAGNGQALRRLGMKSSNTASTVIVVETVLDASGRSGESRRRGEDVGGFAGS